MPKTPKLLVPLPFNRCFGNNFGNCRNFRQIHGLVVTLSVVFAPLASMLSVDFSLKKKNGKIDGWNITATISLIAGAVIGYYNEYKYPIGIPLQIYVLTGVIYCSHEDQSSNSP